MGRNTLPPTVEGEPERWTEQEAGFLGRQTNPLDASKRFISGALAELAWNAEPKALAEQARQLKGLRQKTSSPFAMISSAGHFGSSLP
jgi:hypothetical protein